MVERTRYGLAWTLLGGVLIVAATWAVYGRALHAPFILDDRLTILNNRSLLHVLPLTEHAHPQAETPVAGRPLASLSFAMDYSRGGFDPYSYHLTNLILHALAALLLWALVCRVLRLDYFQGRFDRTAVQIGWAAALLWAVHPLGSETVQYVTQRTELLMGLFYLATLYACLGYWQARSLWSRSAWLVAASLACMLGALSKEVMASAPAIALVFDRVFLSGSFRKALRASWPLYVGLSLSWCVLLSLYVRGIRTPYAGFSLGVPATVWWSTQAEALWLYLRLMVWPWPLALSHDLQLSTSLAASWPWVLAAGALFLASVAGVFRGLAIGFVGLFVLAVLSPTLLIPMPEEVFAERRAYLPLAAVIVAALVLADEGLRRIKLKARRPVFFGGVVALYALFSIVSARHVALYRDPEALWRDSLRTSPKSYVAHANLAALLWKQDRVEEALDEFKQSADCAPEHAKMLFNYGGALYTRKHYEDAIPYLEKSVRLDPTNLNPRCMLAHSYLIVGRLDDAARETKTGLALAKESDRPENAKLFEELMRELPKTEEPTAAGVGKHDARSVRPD